MAAININENQFRELIREEKPVLVDFWAPWCSYCRRIGPAYDVIAQKFEEQLAVVKVNIDEVPSLAQQYRIEVIPTLVFFKNGQPIGSVVAPDSQAAIAEFIRENLEK